MNRMTAFCGLSCAECQAHLATINDDDALRAKTAGMWSKMYQTEIKAEQINCDGCHSGSEQLFGHCHVCEIRACGMEKGVENCAHCDDFACDKLDMIFSAVPEAKATLKQIKATL